ncbi:tRNA pseudouridine(38-40) synthase TruA [Anditalea andensis]|uniref:tRNA pseudouridine synthase A n=1 Tax=Anditalea andensis TaxID=1048983 RepID=A0A074LM28_9BACT|nr:tRNA pseudouridine(38-40) synthase TruA [Anditalea andensis]KEO74942.1 pseudouridylate synthase [Anditalea andensis]
MQNRPHTYLFWIQYLGFRYHGWQKQPNLKTIQGRLERVIRYVLGHDNFSILAAGRTDSGVSCENGAFELFNIDPIIIGAFIEEVNISLPDDIRLLSGQVVSSKFNIIQDVQSKEYRYYFTHGEKPHAFVAGNMAWVHGTLDIGLIEKAVDAFIGEHDFRRFCSKNKNTDNYVRKISEAEIIVVDPVFGNLYPEKVYCFRVKGTGFLMHQVRMMVGALFLIGQGKLTREDIKEALVSPDHLPLAGKAPAHGLVLNNIWFDENRL